MWHPKSGSIPFRYMECSKQKPQQENFRHSLE